MSEDSEDSITQIVWQYPTTMDTNSQGFIDVENALNEMMERDIGVHVTFEPVDLMNTQNDASLKIAAGEQLDIMLTAFTSIGNVVSKGIIIPLDDLLDRYGQDILAHTGTLEMCGYQGKTYGVTPAGAGSNAYGYMIKKKYWDKYNLAEITGWTEEKVYWFKEIEHIFEIVKKGEGDNFYCDVPWNTTPEPMNNGYIEYDKLGGSLATGVLMLNRDFTDTTVYNLFETEEYAQYCEMRYEWARKGYISPDAAVTTEAPNTLAAQDNYLGVFYWDEPQEMITYDRTIGCELVSLDIVPRYAAYNGGVGGWNITVNCKNPDKAMQVLNYIFQNPDAGVLLQYGIEGSEYEVVAEENGLKQIKMLSDNLQTLPYFMAYGVWIDQERLPDIYPNAIGTNIRHGELIRSVSVERISPAFGYSFDQNPVAAEVAVVSSVIEQYTPSLNCGAMDTGKRRCRNLLRH